MNSSIWLEQIDKALIDTLKSRIKIDGKEIDNIVVRKPDEDFKVDIFPMITLYNTSILFDSIRYYPDLVKVSDITAEHASKPYILNYQIDLWSTKQSVINKMLSSWLVSFNDRDFCFTANTVSNDIRPCYARVSDSIIKSDFILSSERVFRYIIEIQVYTDIESDEIVDIDTVTEIHMRGDIDV